MSSLFACCRKFHPREGDGNDHGIMGSLHSLRSVEMTECEWVGRDDEERGSLPM